MSLVLAATVVFLLSAVMSMSGLGTALFLVPFFFWLGIPLREAMVTALLLNAIGLAFAAAVFFRGGFVHLRAALPMAASAMALAPLGAWSSRFVSRDLLLALFVGFLGFAGAMMLWYRPAAQESRQENRGGRTALGLGVGGVAGYVGGLLGVGGGNIIVPVLTWLGYDPKLAAGTTAFVVVFASLAGFLGHVSLGGPEPALLVATAAAATAGAVAGAWLARFRLSGVQLRKVIGILLWLVAGRLAWGLL